MLPRFKILTKYSTTNLCCKGTTKFSPSALEILPKAKALTKYSTIDFSCKGITKFSPNWGKRPRLCLPIRCSPQLELCKESCKVHKIALKTGHTGFRRRLIIKKIAFDTTSGRGLGLAQKGKIWWQVCLAIYWLRATMSRRLLWSCVKSPVKSIKSL